MRETPGASAGLRRQGCPPRAGGVPGAERSGGPGPVRGGFLQPRRGRGSPGRSGAGCQPLPAAGAAGTRRGDPEGQRGPQRKCHSTSESS